MAKVAVGWVVTVIVLIAKTEISTASSSMLYQPKLPKDHE
ncbi:cyclic lactone autoinducer peptide [Alkalihalobacillus sp. MEB130]|nr:cyclic lactone autoinducer peptide [Alkalihalobacillus sp. MEB130]MDT8860751.1 cyclic lactone autoinducer peptide [Alkalihalobacillus sp. MEB130]